MTKKDEKLEALKTEHGRIAAVELEGVTYYFRKPTMPEYQQVSDKMSNKGSNISALKELCYQCSVGDDCVSALASMPASIQQIGAALLDMAGSEVEVLISKA